MRGKKRFLENMLVILNNPTGSDHDVVREVIENCAIIAEKNTNQSGDYDVGYDIALTLRKLKDCIA